MRVAAASLRRVASGAVAAAVAVAPHVASAACADWNPIEEARARPRPLTAATMIELANFGLPDSSPSGGAPLAISPDGRRVAFVLQRADLATNGYCQALVVIDLTGRAAPRVLDRGGDYMVTGFVFRAMYIPVGAARLNAPAWSGDGQSIAYLRRDGGSTQVWRARLDGSAPAPVTSAPVDVEAWSWGADGRSLVYSVRPARLAAERAIDIEGQTGWHYDARTAPMYGIRPQAVAPQPTTALAIDPDSGRTRAVTPADRILLERDRDADFETPRRNGDGVAAWIERSAASPLSPFRLVVAGVDGKPLACGATCASGVSALWWEREGRGLTFVRREGWNKRYTALYRWAPGRGEPVALVRTDDTIEGCEPAGQRLVCIREGATQPPRLVAIDRTSGAQRVLFDPNPAFSQSVLGRVERLEWRNAMGRAVYGDLVLPPGYRGRTRLPTIVVQYRSRGFLRGGTGNEYPIFLFAKRGFAVLSIQYPAMVAEADPGIRSEQDVGRVNTKDWAERRNTLSAVEAGVRMLVSRGIADPARIGITGLSDGASTVRFALSTTDTFAAAAISTCCIDESSDLLVGPAWASFSAGIGYPPAYPVDTKFWQPYSLVLNADHMSTPLLMQLADQEALYGLPTLTALSAYRQPVDLFVFPDEYHNKWQPVHRRAIFERNLDWFSFWLQDRADAASGKAEQFARWRALRDARLTRSTSAR